MALFQHLMMMPVKTGNPKFFTPAEFRTLELLANLVIPADDHSPGALAAQVPAYIDLTVSEQPQDMQLLWREGLAAINQTSRKRFGCDFSSASTEQKFELMDWLSDSENIASALKDQFFVELKRAVATGFYTSEIGLHVDLRYEGNVFVNQFTGGCTDTEHHDG